MIFTDPLKNHLAFYLHVHKFCKQEYMQLKEYKAVVDKDTKSN